MSFIFLWARNCLSEAAPTMKAVFALAQHEGHCIKSRSLLRGLGIGNLIRFLAWEPTCPISVAGVVNIFIRYDALSRVMGVIEVTPSGVSAVFFFATKCSCLRTGNHVGEQVERSPLAPDWRRLLPTAYFGTTRTKRPGRRFMAPMWAWSSFIFHV